MLLEGGVYVGEAVWESEAAYSLHARVHVIRNVDTTTWCTHAMLAQGSSVEPQGSGTRGQRTGGGGRSVNRTARIVARVAAWSGAVQSVLVAVLGWFVRFTYTGSNEYWSVVWPLEVGTPRTKSTNVFCSTSSQQS